MLKAEKLIDEAKEKIISLRAEGHSFQSIAAEVNSEFQTQLTKLDVFRYFDRRKEQAYKVVLKNEEFEGQQSQRFFTAFEQMQQLKKEMWDLFYQMKAESKQGNTKKLIRIADYLLRQINLEEKILTSLQRRDKPQTLNIVEFNNKFQKTLPIILRRLERQGEIKILNRRISGVS